MKLGGERERGQARDGPARMSDHVCCGCNEAALIAPLEARIAELERQRDYHADQTQGVLRSYDKQVAENRLLTRDLSTARSLSRTLVEALEALLDSPSSFDDARLKYREAQILRADEDAARAALQQAQDALSS